MIKFDYINNSELPYRVEIDSVRGAGITEKKAIMAALSVGGFIPKGCRDPKMAVRHLFWNYEVNEGWNIIIQKLSENNGSL